MPLTPADVRNKQFSTTRLRPGYDEEEVDAFLDEVEVELDRLIQENEELRSKLAEVMRGGKPAVAALSSPLADPEPEMLAPEPMHPEPERRPEPVMSRSTEDNMDTAARVLALAQQAFQIGLEPAAVLTLEGTQVIHPPFELLALLHQGAHRLAVPLLGIPLQALGARPRVAGDLLGLTARLVEYVVSLPASPSEGLVGLAPGIGDRLVRGLLGEGQDPCGGVHVVLGRGYAHHDRLWLPALRLGPRLGSHQLGLRLGQR